MSEELNKEKIFSGFNENISSLIDEPKQTGCVFGVSYLDDSLAGIFSNDLVLVGAKTGAGKTQLATIIAMQNALRGKRVAFFALEAEEKEIERRILYQRVSDKFFSMPKAMRPNVYLNFQDWRFGLIPELGSLKSEAIHELSQDIQIPIEMYYRKPGVSFTGKILQKILCEEAQRFDLIIIDHIHYFDWEDDNENRAIRETLKLIRDTAIVCGKPVVLVAHMRKSDRKVKQIVPDADDFHGSSDLTKIPTRIVTMAPSKDEATGGFMTNMRICKNRVDGERARFMARCFFDTRKQSYVRDYQISKCYDSQEEPKWLMQHEIPQWAKNARPDPSERL